MLHIRKYAFFLNEKLHLYKKIFGWINHKYLLLILTVKYIISHEICKDLEEHRVYGKEN